MASCTASTAATVAAEIARTAGDEARRGRLQWWRQRLSDWRRKPGEEPPQLAPAVVIAYENPEHRQGLQATYADRWILVEECGRP